MLLQKRAESRQASFIVIKAWMSSKENMEIQFLQRANFKRLYRHFMVNNLIRYSIVPKLD
jgi:hypothetical protein